MTRLLSVLFVATILAGCASQQAANQITADCSAPDGSISAACASKHPAFGNLSRPAQQQVTHRNMVNELVAANKLTKAQADFLQFEYEGKLQNHIDAENAVRSQAASNAMATTGAALILAGQPRPAQPVYPINQMRTTNCNALGTTVNCTSY